MPRNQAPGPGGSARSVDSLDSRLPGDVAETLSDAQREALQGAFAGQAWTRSPVNIRFSLPFINRRFYVTIVSGEEKRSRERRDSERHHYPLRTAANVFFFVGLATAFYVAALVALALQSAIVEF